VRSAHSAALENGGFETPVVSPGFPRVTNDSKVPGWSATVTNFEIWPLARARFNGRVNPRGFSCRAVDVDAGSFVIPE